MPPKPSPTHFLCIPLASTQLAQTLGAFRTDVTSPMSFGVPPDAVRPLGTLHLTLGVMSLKDDGIARAVALLKSLRSKEILSKARAAGRITSPSQHSAGVSGVSDGLSKQGISITLQGLHPMQEASKTSVLYAPPLDPELTLYRFCEGIRATFIESGIMTDEGRPLLLHATIINTIYVKSPRTPGRGKRRERLTLDARDIVSRYDDYVWMEEMPVERIAICRMGAKKIEGTDDEAYEVEAEVTI